MGNWESFIERVGDDLDEWERSELTEGSLEAIPILLTMVLLELKRTNKRLDDLETAVQQVALDTSNIYSAMP